MYTSTFTSWADVVAGSLANLWLGVVGFIPSLVGALVILIVGLIVATGLGKIVEKVLMTIRFDSLLSSLGLEEYTQRAGMRLRGSHVVGRIVHWFLVIVFLLAAADVLGLYALSTFLRDVLFFVPNVIVAVLIMLAAVVLGNFLRKLVMASVVSARLHASHFLGLLTWWTIVVFGFLAALTQLNVATAIIQTLVTGFIAMLALAGGLAFGLGGRDHASKLLDRLWDRAGRM